MLDLNHTIFMQCPSSISFGVLSLETTWQIQKGKKIRLETGCEAKAMKGINTARQEAWDEAEA